MLFIWLFRLTLRFLYPPLCFYVITLQMKIQQAALELKLTPALVLLRSTLDQLQEKDTAKIFSQPVNLSEVGAVRKQSASLYICIGVTLTRLTILFPWFTEVPDYLEFISQPMDFSTMRKKLEGHAYCSIADLEKDFDLVISNCLKYNSKDTMFHKAALQLREVGGAVLRHAHRQSQGIGLDPSTGMHLPDTLNKHGFNHCTWDDGEFRVGTGYILVNVTVMSCAKLLFFPLLLSAVDSLLDPDNRLHLNTDEGNLNPKTSVIRVNRFNSSDFHVVTRVDRGAALHVYHQRRQPQGTCMRRRSLAWSLTHLIHIHCRQYDNWT